MNALKVGGVDQPQPDTLVDLVRRRAGEQPDRKVLVFLEDGQQETESLSYGQLHRRATAIGRALLSAALRGDRVLLLFPPGLDFVAAFFGCLYSGLVAVPAYPPRRNQKTSRLLSISEDARPAIVLAPEATLSALRGDDGAYQAFSSERLMSLEQAEATLGDSVVAAFGPAAHDLAFLQYTSGSTSLPKGVMVTHANLMANSAYIRESFGLTADTTVSVSWLPSYHDMGLIDGILQPIFCGFTGHLMPPAVFFQQPAQWLQAISRYRATHSGGPDFAYALCARSVPPELRRTLDLSCWTSAYNGAEPVRAATMDAFSDAFAISGFRKSSFYPCYGMAETTLMVSGGAIGELPCEAEVAADELERGLARSTGCDNDKTVRLVSSGRARDSTNISIVDPSTSVLLGDDRVGEIWVSGPSVARGYWNNIDATAQTFQAMCHGAVGGPFLRTGDLGFLRRGELYVTGRLKDMLIVRGRNHYPQDIEFSAEQSHVGLRRASNAAFAIEVDREERLVVVQEVERTQVRRLDIEAVAHAVRQSVVRDHGIQPHVVVFLRPGRIPKTSSGKIQRQACKQAFESGSLETLGVSTIEDPGESSPDVALRAELVALPIEARALRVAAYVRELTGRLLGIPALHVALGKSPVACGLDSLGQTQLRHRLEQGLGIPLPASDFQAQLSLQAVSDLLLSLLERSSEFAEPHSQQESSNVLSKGQAALWFLHRLDPASAAYNVALSVDIGSPLTPSAFGAAINSLLQRHPILASAVVDDGVAPHFVASESTDVAALDAVGWSDDKVGAEIEAEAHRPFRLDRCLFRARLLTQASDRHTLLLAAHHIAMDFRSMELALEQFARACTALRSSGLPGPRRQSTASYARWQERFLATAEAERQLGYWRERLSAPHAPIDLPRDTPRTPGIAPQGKVQRYDIGSQLTQRLRQFARAQGLTAYAILLAVFKVQLHRYTGQETISVGSSMDVRPPGFDDVVGYLVNQVVLRSQLDGELSFIDMVRCLQQDCDDARSCQDYPFSQVVSAVRPGRDDARSPLFEVMFNHLRSSRARHAGAFAVQLAGFQAHLHGLLLKSRPLARSATQFDLMLTTIDTEESMAACWEFDAALFHPSTIERMHGHFVTLLASVLSDPSKKIGWLPLLTSAERTQLLVQWNDTSAPFPAQATLHELYEEQARRVPASIAIVDGPRAFSHRQLDGLANKLAHRLHARGIRRGELVGIFTHRCAEMVIAVLGVLKAGGAYVPLDPAQPQARLSGMLNDASPALVLASRALAPRIDGLAPLLHLDDVAEVHLEHELPRTRPPTPVQARDLAYVIYTSGSTGQPKGVMIPHSGAVNYATWAMREYLVETGAGAPVNSSLAFDATITSLLVPLLAGRSVVLLPEEEELAALAQVLQGERRFSLVKITPAHLEILRSYLPPSVEGVNANAFVVGGEALLPSTVRDWRAIARNTRIINEYGPTETVVGCCTYEVVDDLPSSASGVPIGKPIANTRMYVLDSRRQPVPIGIVGELYISGAGVGLGYLNRPELTAERFVHDPFSEELDARMYKTGDQGRWLADGNLEYLGRNDSQVKIRGFRVELGEIEAQLMAHPAVREAAVTVSEGQGNKSLTGHVALTSPQADPVFAELASYLEQRLPRYMVPTAWVKHDQLPLTTNGKVHRQRLATLKPVASAAEITVGKVLPTTDVQKSIAEVWCELIGLEAVGIHDNFFDAGGHSLLAAQVHQRLLHRLGLRLSLVDIYQYPTISALEQRLASLGSVAPRIDLSQAHERAQRRLDRGATRSRGIDATPQ